MNPTSWCIEAPPGPPGTKRARISFGLGFRRQGCFSLGYTTDGNKSHPLRRINRNGLISSDPIMPGAACLLLQVAINDHATLIVLGTTSKTLRSVLPALEERGQSRVVEAADGTHTLIGFSVPNCCFCNPITNFRNYSGRVACW